ncbi:hypothetical protein SPI_09122 [Niveomyces insectorum RCEF 264]|uniref:HRQ family protein 2 n=1 Tax=Niveomyces insectorum RCEF 264 TaxID=1081102 RepID=A0A162I936_9HYPO|nr:hypothetical protein SPI_09122 [Niveomyces insectorum RCEF 264]
MEHGNTLAFVGLAVLLLAWLVRKRQTKGRDVACNRGATGAKKSQSSPLPSVKPLSSFDWQAAEPVQFRPFKPIYHITLALQSTTPEDLIVLDRNYKDRVLLRRALIAEHAATVLGVTGSEETPDPAAPAKAAVDELYRYLMASYLPARYPTVFVQEQPAGRQSEGTGGAVLHNRVTGATFPCAPPSDPREALRILGETVEDDLFLLQQDNVASVVASSGSTTTTTATGHGSYPSAGHRLVAFLCCFPSGFDPSAKLGLLLRDIHAPVPAFDKIGPSMERFFARLNADKSVKRLNWSIQTHPNLFVPAGNHVHDGDCVAADEDVDMEKTLTRLPATRAVLFSFKTYLFPVPAIRAEGHGPALADAIDGLKRGNAPGMWVYKGGIRWGKSVAAYLRS